MSDSLARRPRLTIVAIEERPLAGVLTRKSPFTVQVEGLDLTPFPVPAGLGKKHWAAAVEAERPCRILTDNEGARHFFWVRDDSATPQVWYFTRRKSGAARAWSDEGVEFTTFHPNGVFRSEYVNWAAARTMEVGAQIGWEYPFQEVSRPVGKATPLVLGCGGGTTYFLPLTYLEPKPAVRNPWPEYVRMLLRVYNSDEAWQRLIRSLRGRYFHGLFAEGVPIKRALNALVTRGREPGAGIGEAPRTATAYCFDGELPLDQQTAGGLSIRSAVAWGDRGDLAWIYRVNNTTAAVVVDRPQTDRAGWIFPDEAGAAALLAPLPDGVEWKDRQQELKRQAIYYCTHHGAWEERLVMIVLHLLAEAGYEPAKAAYDARSKRNADVTRQVSAAIRRYRRRQENA